MLVSKYFLALLVNLIGFLIQNLKLIFSNVGNMPFKVQFLGNKKQWRSNILDPILSIQLCLVIKINVFIHLGAIKVKYPPLEKIDVFSAEKCGVAQRKVTQIQRCTAMLKIWLIWCRYFEHVKIRGTTFCVSWRKRPFPPDFAVIFLTRVNLWSVQHI